MEEKVLHGHFHENPAGLDHLLHPNFEEINTQGQSVTRREVIEWLCTKNPDARWNLDRFSIKEFGTDLVIATYHARKVGSEDSSGSIRSSVWYREGKDWLLIHHHATKPKE